MTVELEIYSDFNCTWCYFDKPAVTRLKNAYKIHITWRAFPLHPDLPAGGMPILELFGNNQSLMTDKMTLLENKAAELGLPLAKRTAISDSRLSHELAKWAETLGRTDDYREAVYSAYFAQGADIADPSVLLDIAERAGLPRDKAGTILEKRKFSQAVDGDWEKSENLGIMVAPTYIPNRDRLTGSQSYESLEALMASNGIEKRG
ncbi:MAG: DsbA family protein [Desulfobacterales bacterium]|nr:DsbA family protein [Desulfobacterales bacterium]